MLHTHVQIVEIGDPAPFPELAGKPTHMCELDRVAVLQGGMTSGRSSVSFSIDLPDGSIAFIQTSARNFELIAATVRGACLRWNEDNS